MFQLLSGNLRQAWSMLSGSLAIFRHRVCSLTLWQSSLSIEYAWRWLPESNQNVANKICGKLLSQVQDPAREDSFLAWVLESFLGVHASTISQCTFYWGLARVVYGLSYIMHSRTTTWDFYSAADLDWVLLVDSWAIVCAVSSECDIQRCQKLVHARKQGIRAMGCEGVAVW